MSDAEARLREVADILAEHAGACRRNGIRPPGWLAYTLLLASGGLERPTVALPSTMDDALLITYETAASLLATSTRTVRRLIAAGELPTVDVGGPRIRRGDLVAYVDRLPTRKGA